MGTQSSPNDGFMRHNLSTYQTRGIRDPTRTKYEYSSIDEVGD